MNNQELQREDNVFGYTAFAMFVAGAVLPFFVSSNAKIDCSEWAFVIWEGLAVYLGILGRHTRIGRVAWRSALLLAAIASIAILWEKIYLVLIK
jgi:hypothetical protein